MREPPVLRKDDGAVLPESRARETALSPSPEAQVPYSEIDTGLAKEVYYNSAKEVILMAAKNDRRKPGSSFSKKLRHKAAVRNTMIIASAVLVMVLIFVFGINQWRIEIHLNGEDEVVRECGIPYEDEGAAAELTGSVLSFVHHPIPVDISAKGVNIHEPGTYTVTFSAKFLALRAEDTRTVNIVDTTPPAIELKHIDDYYTLPHHEYEEEGFTAIDNHDGDITDKVTREEKDGTVYYSVTDQAGNTALAEREIFYDDRNAPVFHFPSGEEAFIFKGETWEDDVRAEDDADGDVSDRIERTGEVNLAKAGTYTLTYKVSDEWGNEAEKSRYVTVKRKAPAIPKKMDPTKVIYLTFDDGPGPYTEDLLKILAKHKVRATFFVTAANEDYRDLIRAEYKAGHTVAVHTATHDYEQIYSSSEAYWDDFNKMQDIVREQTGCRTDLFRFPGGSSNTISANYCDGIMTQLAEESKTKGYTYVDWNVTSGDAGDTTDGSVMYQNMMNGIHTYEKSFILCHDIKDYTVKMMDRFITDALKEGYTFLPITSETQTCHHGINN